MHDIGRTQLETMGEYAEVAAPSELQELGDGAGEYESGEFEAGGAFGGFDGSAELEEESPLSESMEMELASELLEIGSEQELEQFLGNVARAVGSTVGRFVRSDTGRALGGILKDSLRSAARQALPVVGRAIGGAVDPRYADVGGRAGSAVGTLLGLELEGLSAQDQEFEVARQLVRFTGSAIRQAALAPRRLPPEQVARAAVAGAARRYAPGLLPRLRGRSGRLWPRSGRWVRRGRTIVLYGM